MFEVVEGLLSKSFCITLYNELYNKAWTLNGKSIGVPFTNGGMTWSTYMPEAAITGEFNKILHQQFLDFNVLEEDEYTIRQWATGSMIGQCTTIHADDAGVKTSYGCIFYPHDMNEYEGGENLFYDPQGKLIHKQTPKAGTCVFYRGDYGHESIPPTFNFKNYLRIIVNTLYAVGKRNFI
tara:strand:+ start:275 stop:814 length:540 start_codon:yes stop_codon:yes gene_type:complete